MLQGIKTEQFSIVWVTISTSTYFAGLHIYMLYVKKSGDNL